MKPVNNDSIKLDEINNLENLNQIKKKQQKARQGALRTP
jgi:hypothetical protein